MTSTTGPGTLIAPTYLLDGGTIDTMASLGTTGMVTQNSGLTMLKGTIGTPSVTIAGGILQLEDNNRHSSATNLTMTGGALDLNGNAQALATLNGTGSILLSSNSSAGALTVGSGTYGGTIADNGSQGGQLTVSGPGVFILSGINSYSGATTVNGGTFTVNGSIANSAVTVNAAGVLSGSGTVGSTNVVGGVLAPVGTLHVAGNLTMNASSTYAIGLTSSAASLTAVSGMTSLAGTVAVSQTPGAYFPAQYTIISAKDVSGTFAPLALANLPATLSADLSYTPTSVNLNLLSQIASAPGLSGNAASVAGAIDRAMNSNSSNGSAFAGLYGLSGLALNANLVGLAGQTGASTQQVMYDAMGGFLGTMIGPFGAAAGSGGVRSFAAAPGLASGAATAYAAATPYYVKATPKPVDDIDARWGTWASAFGGSQTLDSSPGGGTADLAVRIYGMAGGADYRMSPDAHLGFAISGGVTNFNLSSGLGLGHSDFLQIGAYGQQWPGPAYAALAFGYGVHGFDTDRDTAVVGLEDLHARFVSHTLAGRIEAGYRVGFAGSGVTPYGAYQLQHMMTPSYAEATTGASSTAALSFASNDTTAGRSEAGAWFDQALAANITLRARAAWVHEFDRDSTATPTFEALPGATFVVNGVTRPADSALLSGVAEYLMTRNVMLAAKLDGEIAPRGSSLREFICGVRERPFHLVRKICKRPTVRRHKAKGLQSPLRLELTSMTLF